jgi:hypothetical protein
MDLTGWEHFSYPGTANMQDPGNIPFMTASYGIAGPVRNAGGDPGNRPFDVDQGVVLRDRGILPYKIPVSSAAPLGLVEDAVESKFN